MSKTVSIPTLAKDGFFNAYVALPSGEPKAAIVVIQEIFGVNKGIRQKCDNLAVEGYLAIAPDLFWRLKPGIELDPDVEEEFQEALSYMNDFDQDAGVRDIQATLDYVRSSEGVSKVGCVGYCLGGRLAFMTAARTNVDASVAKKKRSPTRSCFTFRPRTGSSTRTPRQPCTRVSTIIPRRPCTIMRG